MDHTDKIKKLQQDIDQLRELVNKVAGEEIYPVSFFSEAYDRLQQIQRTIQALETSEIELFSDRIKKEQQLIEAVKSSAVETEAVEEALPEPLVVSEEPEEELTEEAPFSDLAPESPPDDPESVPGAPDENLSIRPLYEQMEVNRLADLTKAFSLNEQIRFNKYVFENDSERMKQTLTALNACTSLQEALDYFGSLENWNPEKNEAARDLIELLKKHFLNNVLNGKTHTGSDACR